MQRVCLPEDEAKELYMDLMGFDDGAGLSFSQLKLLLCDTVSPVTLYSF